MHFSYYVYLILFFTASLLVLRYFFLRRTSLPTQLYIKGLRTENSGDYEEATIAYESALDEVNKNRFHQSLKNKIIEKLKVLRTVKNYEKDQNFRRENNSWIS